MDKEVVLSKIREEFPTSVENETTSYTAFQVQNEKGKLQNFVEIHFQKNRVKIFVLSRFLSDEDKKVFRLVSPKSGWSLDAEYYIQSEDDMNTILPFIRKSYEGIRKSRQSLADFHEQEFRHWIEQEKVKKGKTGWQSVDSKISWLKGENYQDATIRISPIKELLLEIETLSEEEISLIRSFPENLFSLSATSFQKAHEQIVDICQEHKKAISKVVRKRNLQNTNSAEFANFKVTVFAKEYLQFLSQKERIDMKSTLTATLLTSHNLILRGAPGTGKTYLAKQVAEELTGNEDQIGFVQFHPSYDYTDFVEGLRPVKDDSGEIKFDIKPGIFKEFCQKAIDSSKSGGQDNFEEAWAKFWEAVSDETDAYKMKTLTGKPMNLVAYVKGGMTGVTEKNSSSLFFNRKQCYNVYRGLPGVPKGGLDTYRKAIIKEMTDKFDLKPYKAPEDIQSDKKFVFIIDEINRGEISKIFGELFYAIDPGYRGKKGEILTQYANMYEEEEKFFIPENVYIIGTMNDIDRSVDSFDFAMRRRFRFVEITAAESLGMWDGQLDASEIPQASLRLTKLNEAIENVADLNRNYHVGPSYFLKLPELGYDYKILWQDYLQPLLEEYLRGTYQEAEQLKELKVAFDCLEEMDYVD
ncbi:TPA: McrB family protein [Streptococcus suis]